MVEQPDELLRETPYAIVEIGEPLAVEEQSVAQRLRGRRLRAFLEALLASDASENHQRNLHHRVLGIVVAFRKAYLEELVPHSVDIYSHSIDEPGP